jgi:GT2 family glycosyltransferase
MKSSCPLYVVIATCGQPALLERTLRGLAACPKPAQYAGTLVVENGPPCGVHALVASFPPQHLFHYAYSAPANKSLALNRAVALLDPALVLFTDDDVLPLETTLQAYAAAGQGRWGGQFYGGPIVPDYEDAPPADWLRPLLPRSAAGWRLETTAPRPIGQPEFIGPNFAAFTRDVIRVGGFDEELGPGPHRRSPGEDTDLQARLLAAGVQGLYLPEAAMRHFVRTGNTSLDFACTRAERNGIYWGIARGRQRGFFPLGYLKTCGQWLNDCWRIARWQRSADPQRQARAQWLARRWRGRWQGLALARHWPPPRWSHKGGPETELVLAPPAQMPPAAACPFAPERFSVVSPKAGVAPWQTNCGC